MPTNSQQTNSTLSPQQAAQEIIRRQTAQGSLAKFTEYTKPDFQTAHHHKVITEKLEAVERGEIDRLMIFAPPRHTKSELASRRFPAWYLGRNPNKQIITATYAGDLASDFGRDVRNIVREREYSNLFPDVSLRDDSKAANRWHTNKGGVYVSVGVGGAITGRGADIALIDDPLKNRKDADSETIRDSIWDWYTSTLYTRLMPGGAIVLIQTRWHEDDLAGRLLEQQKHGGDQWEIINLEAITNEGTDKEEALWPAWYPIEALKRIQANVGAREFSALYQQKPQPEEGVYFKREWFNRYTLGEHPKNTNPYGAGDYAVSDGEGDFSEEGIIEVDSDKNIWFTDWWSGQTSPDVWISTTIDLMLKHNPEVWLAESGVIRKATEPYLRSTMEQRNAWTVLEWLTTSGDKRAMARSFQGMAAAGKVYIPLCEWGDALIDQLIRFDSGVYDDKVDVCGLFGRYLAEMWASSTDEPEPEKRRKDYAFDDDEQDDWQTL